MARLSHPKGFTLIELLLAMSLMTSLSLVMIPLHIDTTRSDKELLISSIIQTQYTALRDHSFRKFESPRIKPEFPIEFTGKGMTNQAQTIGFENNGHIVIMLGPGRIHE